MSPETNCISISLAILLTALWTVMVLYADYIVAQFNRVSRIRGENISVIANILGLPWQSPTRLILSTGAFALIAIFLGIMHWAILLLIAIFGFGRFSMLLFADTQRLESLISQRTPLKPISPPLRPLALPINSFLFGKSGEYKGVEFECVPKMKIGRRKSNDLILREKRVSREHAKLGYSGGIWYIQDQKSATGTYVNGKRERAIRLKHGDIIKIGSSKFEFKEG